MEVKENISITSLDVKDVEYIYLLHEREFLRLQQPIFKLGKTKQSHNKRMCGYPKGSQLLLQILSNNCDEDEKKLLALFRQQFKPRIDIGAEYFEGDRDQMIVSIVQNVDFKRKQPQQITLQVSETPSGIKSYIITDQDKTHVLVANNCETEQKKDEGQNIFGMKEKIVLRFLKERCVILSKESRAIELKEVEEKKRFAYQLSHTKKLTLYEAYKEFDSSQKKLKDVDFYTQLIECGFEIKKGIKPAGFKSGYDAFLGILLQENIVDPSTTSNYSPKH